jgi:pectate lyase
MGDKKIVREFSVGGTAGPGVTVYNVGVITGNARNAGTDCDVTITVVGTIGKVEKKRLSNDPRNHRNK